MSMELIKSFDIADIPETEYNLYTFFTEVVTHIYKEIYMKEKAVSLADRAYETIKTNIRVFDTSIIKKVLLSLVIGLVFCQLFCFII